MATPVPGTILTNPAQTQDIGSYYVDVQTVRQLGYDKATPQIRSRGLIMDLPTSEEAYAVAFPPISLGTTQTYKDGNRPGNMKPQETRIKGSVLKRGITPLRLFEADRMANRIPVMTPAIMARGRSERLMEDEQYTVALENGTSAALQPSYDEKAFFANNHFIDPVGTTGSQSNLITTKLTADSLGAAKLLASGWKAENGMPLYAGFTPEWLLEVPPALRNVAEKICNRSHVAEGGAALENIESGTKYFVNSFLTNSTAWYLHVTNAGMPLCYRMVFREMQRWDMGPESALYQTTKAIEIYADEWTDYRLNAWPLAIKSTGLT